MKKLENFGSFLKNVILFTGLFFLLPKLNVFLFMPEASLVLNRSQFMDSVGSALTLAIVVSLIVTFTNNRKFFRNQNAID
jgi:hypothetical protein